MKSIKQNYEIGDIVFVSKYKYNNETSDEGRNHLFVIIDQEKIEAVSVE